MPAASNKSHRTYRGESMEQRRARRRAQFLVAGKKVFGDQGYRAATLRGICREAGLTERYFYESFSNPQDLFTAVHDELLKQLREVLSEAIATAPREQEALARSVIEAYYRLLRSDPRLTRILLIEIYGTTQDLERLYRRGIQDFADMLRDLLVPRMAPKAESHLDPDLLATSLVGAAVHLAIRWHLSGYAEPLDTIVANCMAIYMGTVGRVSGAGD